MQRAIISVSDKRGLIGFGARLTALNIEILSTGGTAKALRSGGVKVMDVSDYTGFPEMMDGRLKTLHPRVHGGILNRRSNAEDQASMLEHGIKPIDMVIVNLYPFQATIAKEGVSWDEAIENIDIGGPTMVRAAAKNHESVVVVVDPDDYEGVLTELESEGSVGVATRKRLAGKAFAHTAAYDLVIARYVSGSGFDGFVGRRVATCKYGENAWQAPAHLYSTGTRDPLALDKFVVLEGTPPSYNNWCDIERMLQTVTHIATGYPMYLGVEIAVGVKHGNPCGAAAGPDSVEVTKKMMAGDPLAIFGGLVMTSFEVDEAVCEPLTGKMLDGIIAPAFTAGAIAMLRRKGDKCRFIVNPALSELDDVKLDQAPRFRYVRGGFLVQPNYAFVPRFLGEGIKKYRRATPVQECDMMLAWAIGSTSNSNTITLVKNEQLIGNGVGQQDRVGAANLAITRARRSGHDLLGAVAYSDSFFPFPDGPQTLIDAGITAIFTSSGSVKDHLTIDVCGKHNVVLYMVEDQLGRGFFGH